MYDGENLPHGWIKISDPQEAQCAVRTHGALYCAAPEALEEITRLPRIAADRGESLTRRLAETGDAMVTPLGNALRALCREKGYDDRAVRDLCAFLRLFRNLCDLARIDRCLLRFEQEAIDLNGWTSALAEAIRPRLAERKRNLHVELAEQTGWVVCDGEKLLRCALNLISNAIQFSADGDKVLLRTERGPVGMVFSVQDDGRGMSKAQARHLFSGRASMDGPLPGNGRGVGLAVTRRFVEGMRGRLTVSGALGKGTCASILLPAVDAACICTGAVHPAIPEVEMAIELSTVR